MYRNKHLLMSILFMVDKRSKALTFNHDVSLPVDSKISVITGFGITNNV